MPAPQTEVGGIWVDRLDRTWVFVQVADRDWRAGFDLTPVGRHGWRVDGIDPPRLFDTVIEVLDLNRRRVVARQRIDESCASITPSGQLVCRDANADGTHRVELRSLTFVDDR